MCMTPSELIAHFGTQSAASGALGVAQSLISDWAAQGYIPIARQIIIERKTGGALLANLDDAVSEVARRQRPLISPAA
jgi:DNA-binding transcriptional regulator YdaS (Cro superfamily)